MRDVIHGQGLPAELMYGIKVEGVSGTTWVHQAKASHVTVFVSIGS